MLLIGSIDHADFIKASTQGVGPVFASTHRAEQSKDILLDAIQEIVEVKVLERDRHLLQPRVSQSLLIRFQALGKQHDSLRGSRNHLLKLLRKRLDPRTGKRRPSKKKGRRFRQPENLERFIERGQSLVKTAKTSTSGDMLVKYYFDARSAASASGIKILAHDIGLNLSEFFSALIARGCDELERLGLAEASIAATAVREPPIGHIT